MQNVGSPFAQLESGVVLGMPAATACVFAEPLLSRLAASFPKLKLRVVDRETGQLVDGMLKGEVDLAIIHGPPPDERLFESELLAEDFVLVGGPDSGLAPDRALRFVEIARLPLVLPGHQPGVRSLVEKTGLRLQVEIDIRFEIDSVQVSKELIEAGLAYGILPLSAVGRELQAGRLCYAPLCDPVITQTLVFVARPHLVMPRSFVAKFGTLIRQEAARLVESGAWPARLSFDRP
jgi:DNA-binding transcriptional LysR family regulator